MRYIDNRGTEFELYENGNWDFEVVENNIKHSGELKIKHPDGEYSNKRVLFTFKGVKEIRNDLG